MKNSKEKKKKENISTSEVHKIMVEINKDIVSRHIKASLCELKESTWMGLVRGKNKFYKGRMSREKLDLMGKMGYNLMGIIDQKMKNREGTLL